MGYLKFTSGVQCTVPLNMPGKVVVNSLKEAIDVGRKNDGVYVPFQSRWGQQWSVIQEEEFAANGEKVGMPAAYVSLRHHHCSAIEQRNAPEIGREGLSGQMVIHGISFTDALGEASYFHHNPQSGELEPIANIHMVFCLTPTATNVGDVDNYHHYLDLAPIYVCVIIKPTDVIGETTKPMIFLDSTGISQFKLPKSIDKQEGQVIVYGNRWELIQKARVISQNLLSANLINRELFQEAVQELRQIDHEVCSQVFDDLASADIERMTKAAKTLQGLDSSAKTKRLLECYEKINRCYEWNEDGSLKQKIARCRPTVIVSLMMARMDPYFGTKRDWITSDYRLAYNYRCADYTPRSAMAPVGEKYKVDSFGHPLRQEVDNLQQAQQYTKLNDLYGPEATLCAAPVFADVTIPQSTRVHQVTDLIFVTSVHRVYDESADPPPRVTIEISPTESQRERDLATLRLPSFGTIRAEVPWLAIYKARTSDQVGDEDISIEIPTTVDNQVEGVASSAQHFDAHTCATPLEFAHSLVMRPTERLTGVDDDDNDELTQPARLARGVHALEMMKQEARQTRRMPSAENIAKRVQVATIESDREWRDARFRLSLVSAKYIIVTSIAVRSACVEQLLTSDAIVDRYNASIAAHIERTKLHETDNPTKSDGESHAVDDAGSTPDSTANDEAVVPA